MASVRIFLFLIAALGAALTAGPASASSTFPSAAAAAATAVPHAFNQSYIYLRIESGKIEGRIEINLVDLNRSIGTGFREDLTVTADEVAAEIEKIEAYLYPRIGFAIAGKPIELERQGHAIYRSAGSQYVSCKYELLGIEGIPDALEITHSLMYDTDPEHRGYVVIEQFFDQGRFNNEGDFGLIFDPDRTTQTLDLKNRSKWTGMKAIIREGVHHIWIGHDHILFLIALLLASVLRRDGRGWAPEESFGASLVQVLKIVTVFTIAHSVTLTLAALDVVSIPSKWVESIIALSIAVAALDVFFPIFKKRILLVVLLFGFFHGFGFANVLGDLRITGGDLALSLFGFNIGVEVGQLAIVMVVFPMLFMMRLSLLYTRFFVYAGAALSIFVAMYWFIERAFEVDLTLGEALGPILRLF